MKKYGWILLFILFLAIKLANIVPRISDENLYFYLGKLVAEGFLPYRDFFLANMPGQVMVNGLLIKLFGFNLYVLKLIPIIAALGTGYLVYKITIKKSKEEFGIAAATLFLFSSLVLGITDIAVGVQEAVFFLIFSWYLLLEDRPKAAGLMFFLGLLLRRYIFFAGLGLAFYEMLLKERKKVFSFLLFSLGPFLLVNLAIFRFAGSNFYDFSWKYHMVKEQVKMESSTMTDFFQNERYLLIMGLGFGIMSFKKIWKDAEFVNTLGKRSNQDLYLIFSAIAAIIFQYFFLYQMKIVFLIYFFTLVPFLAVVVGMGLKRFLPERNKKLGLVLVVLISLLNISLYFRNITSKYRIPELQVIVADVLAFSQKGDTIYGSYLVTPLVALYSGRRIILNQADTNAQRYLAGLLTLKEETRNATASAFFLQSVKMDKEGMVSEVDPEFVHPQAVLDYCVPLKQYDVTQDFGFNKLILWECNN